MQTWNSAEAAQRYQQGAVRRAQSLGPVTERMLEGAALGPGMRVLDVAAGTGETSLLAARRVQPGGSVLAVDISASMLGVAAQSAREAGLDNLETVVQDIDALQLPSASFDAAISRLGLMFLSDAAGGLRRVRRALKPGARLAAIVWSTRAANPYMGTSVDVVEERRGLPDEAPAIMRAFSLAGEGTFATALEAGGFEDVRVEPVSLVREFASTDEAIEALVSMSTNLTDLLVGASDDEREQVLAEIRRRFQRFERDGGCLMPGEVLFGRGVQPAECYDQSQ